MTQTMIEQMSAIEYSHLLAYGDPCTIDNQLQTDGDASWICTLESTTYPDMTFGYTDEL